MRKMLFLMVLFGFLFMVNCSAMKVQYDYNQKENFSEYRSFDFLKIPATVAVSPIVMEILKNEISRNLEAKGYLKVQDDPKLLIAVHTYVQGRLNITDWGYDYANRDAYWRESGYWGEIIEAYAFEGSTLIIDVVKVADKKLIWRGVAQKVLEPDLIPDELKAVIQEAVLKILKEFPRFK